MILNEAFKEHSGVVIEEVITHSSNTFNYISIGFVYLSVLVERIIKYGRNILESIVNIALYDILAVILILVISFIMFSVIFSNELVTVVVFVVVGFVFVISIDCFKSKGLSGRR